jgi:hypothetical protein
LIIARQPVAVHEKVNVGIIKRSMSSRKSAGGKYKERKSFKPLTTQWMMQICNYAKEKKGRRKSREYYSEKPLNGE